MKLSMAIVILAACSSKKGDSDHYGGWKAADTKAALQGAWVGPSINNLVNSAAYEISGDTVKFSDGKEEKSFALVLESPCQFGLKQTDGSQYHMAIVMKDGKPVWGGGDAGQRAGERAVVCAGFSVWAVDKGTCHEKAMSGRWKEAKDKCGFRKNKDGKEEFFWTWMDKQEAREMDGDFLMPDAEQRARKVADFAAAKAEVAAAAGR